MVPGGRWLTRPVLAWALYDVASSTFIALVGTFFGLFFVAVVAQDLPGGQGRWGAIASFALALAGGLAPFYGAWADRRGRILGSLAAATVLCVVATVSMPLAGPGDVLLAAVLFVAAQVGYTLAVALYDSLLVRIAPRTHVGRVSAFGWTVGFAGGIVALLAALGVMHGVPADGQAARLSIAFMVAGLLFAAFAIPGLSGLRGLAASPADRRAPGPAARAAYASVIDTLRHWRRHREVFRFLIGFYLINDVLVTVVFFIAIILRARFGLTIEGLLWLALLYHVLAAPATLVFGHAADRWGQRPAIYVMIAILAITLLLLAFGTGSATPVIVVALLALVYGSIQAVCRSLFALLVAREKTAEMFGFNAVAGRLSAALGPLLFGAVAAATGSNAAALVSLLFFLAAGAAMFASLRMPSTELAVPALQGTQHS
jgi:UMF1 family MFS transporter